MIADVDGTLTRKAYGELARRYRPASLASVGERPWIGDYAADADTWGALAVTAELALYAAAEAEAARERIARAARADGGGGGTDARAARAAHVAEARKALHAARVALAEAERAAFRATYYGAGVTA